MSVVKTIRIPESTGDGVYSTSVTLNSSRLEEVVPPYLELKRDIRKNEIKVTIVTEHGVEHIFINESDLKEAVMSM